MNQSELSDDSAARVLDNWLRATFPDDHPAVSAWKAVQEGQTPRPGVQSLWTRDGGPVLDLPPARWGAPFARITTMQSPGQPLRWALAADQRGTMIEPLLLARQRPAGPTPHDLLQDRATPYWVERALRSALDRDPVKAAAEAEVMARALGQHADEVLARAARPAANPTFTPL